MNTKYVLFLFAFLFWNIPTNGQLVLERDINQEAASSSPFYISELNNILYFRADDGIHGDELFQYNLATETAELVADIRPNEDGSSISEIIAFDNKIYFNAKDGIGIDHYLYVYNPADNSSQRLIDSNNNRVKEPSNLAVFNGQLFFRYEHENNDYEVGRYDPVSNQIELVADINPAGSSSPSSFTEVDGQLWFIAIDGQSNSQLWRYDPGTEMVENIIYDSPNAVYPSMRFLYHFDGKFCFQGYTQGTGDELWFIDIATNTLLDFPEIYPGPADSSPTGFTEFDGKLYFVARNLAEAREVRVYDPVSNQVNLVADINPDGSGNPGVLIPIDGKLYFTASEDDTERKLFSYNPDIEEVTVEATLDNGGSANNLTALLSANNTLFLSGTQIEVGTELFQFTPSNSELTLAHDINLTTIGSNPYLFTPFNGKLYFGASEVNSGREIWVYDPTTGNVDILSDSPGNTAPYGFTELDGKLFYSGIDPNLGYGLQYYDETTGLLNPTSYITPNHIGHISDIIAYNGRLYFSANDDTLDQEVFFYDPADDSYGILLDIHPTDGSNPEKFFVFNNELYFQANDGETGTELWKYNSTTDQVSQVADINPGEGSSNPEWFTVYNGELYFSAFVDDLSYDVYSYNATTNEVTQRTDVNGNLNPEYLTVYRDKLFFRGRYSAAVNAELVYYDAATGETVLTEDIAPSASNPGFLTVFNDKLYFATTTEDYGRELWEYNDTTLAIVADIRSGQPDSDPQYLTLFNNKLYFSANDGLRGAELWSIAECLNIFVDTEPQIGPDGFGSIDLTIQGGLPPYTITWSNGATTEDIENLEPGVYTAVVSDASGCLSEVSAEVIFVSSTETLLSEDLVSLFPNPGNGTFNLAIGGLDVKAIDVFDLHGRLVYQKLVNNHGPNIGFQLQYAPDGIYLVKIKTADGLIQKKLVLN